MVARIDNEMFPQLFTPQPELSDSDDVLLALETARALEMQGEIREAARWIRRAAEEAEKQDNDERVLALARAAADLSNTLGALPSAAEVPTMPPPPPAATTPPPDAFEATTPPPASLPAASDSAISPAPTPSDSAPSVSDSALPHGPSPSASPTAMLSNPPLTERSMRIGAIRVAIAEGSIRGVKSFYVERLEAGQMPATGTMEAMLVFSGEIDEPSELEPDLRAAGDETTA